MNSYRNMLHFISQVLMFILQHQVLKKITMKMKQTNRLLLPHQNMIMIDLEKEMMMMIITMIIMILNIDIIIGMLQQQ